MLTPIRETINTTTSVVQPSSEIRREFIFLPAASKLLPLRDSPFAYAQADNLAHSFAYAVFDVNKDL